MLNFQQMLEGLKQGKRYRRKLWEDRPSIVIHMRRDFVEDEDGYAFTLNLSDFEATDWEEVRCCS